MTATPLRIGNHTLPSSLADAVRSRRWGTTHDATRLKRVLGIEDGAAGVYFLDAEGMGFHLDAMKAITRDDPALAETIYGVRSSRQTGRLVDLPFLDVDHGVPLLMTIDEFAVWLDYRVDPPAVIQTCWTDAEPPHTRWWRSAPSFAAFAASLGMPLEHGCPGPCVTSGRFP